MSLREQIEKSATPVLVDVYTIACGPCRRMMPLVDELKAEGHNVVKVDAHGDSEFCEAYDIQVVPTFLVFREGKVVKRLQGMQTKNTLIEALNATAQKDSEKA